jgi:hypothetical protein
MKCTYSEIPYQWQDGDQWHVGRLVIEEHGCVVTEFDGLRRVSHLEDDECVLVRREHTGELRFVPWSHLATYPQGEIPEPTNTGRN